MGPEFLLTSLIVVASPGTGVLVTLAAGLSHGARAAVVAAFGDRTTADRLATRSARDAGADYSIRLGAHRSSSGFAPLPGGGPVLTWRAVNDAGMPPLSNWGLTLGDVELF